MLTTIAETTIAMPEPSSTASVPSSATVGQFRERELVHEQRHGEADAAESADHEQVDEREGSARSAAGNETAETAGERDADDLADGQRDEDAPERRVELARSHLRHDDHRGREREQGKDDAVRPRLERVHRPPAGAPGHHQAERDTGDGRVHARLVDEVPGDDAEQR